MLDLAALPKSVTDVDLIADSVLVAESPSAGSTSWSSVIGIDLRPALVVEVRRHMADVPWVQVLEGDASARANPDRADQTVGEGTGALRPRGMWPTMGRRRNILADHDVRGPDRRVRTSGPRRPSTSWACSSEQSRGWK
ncbi:MAG: hypothetical protein QOG76_4078 [Pseudonocardiales bacterium]|jgi:hypothetical protein|nr:hypothetical protein [Pseudonocardiales bacterium]